MGTFRPSLLIRGIQSVLHTSNRNIFFYSSKQGFDQTWLEKLQNFDFNPDRWKKIAEQNIYENQVKDQRFLKERHFTLGPDLATAHFIVARNGAVKFVGKEEWIQKDENGQHNLPKKFVPDLYLEAVDASATGLLYEGLDNFINLDKLAYLNLSKCPHVDDFFLARLHFLRKTLLYLDVSMCPHVTHNGLASLHHLNKLKRLVIKDMPAVKNVELMALMIEEALPQCIVEGVDYTDTSKLNGLENLHGVNKARHAQSQTMPT